jgi:hypothetical protein
MIVSAIAPELYKAYMIFVLFVYSGESPKIPSTGKLDYEVTANISYLLAQISLFGSKQIESKYIIPTSLPLPY